ncbi:MAG TPA: VacJ family lipoprotein [Syntrophorhabdaceae bacterium]|nr:VacJ family lipoprotein [Syntrophorhabdaceae bacterium]
MAQVSAYDRKTVRSRALGVCLGLTLLLFQSALPAHAAEPASGQEPKATGAGEGEAVAPAPVTNAGPQDEYGNVTEEEVKGGEAPRIADPIEPWNRAIYHVNDKLYFWLLKPVTRGYKYVLPESLRIIVSNFYENLKTPIRFVNNLLQGRPVYAGKEVIRFLINSTVGVAGFKDCAKECLNITGRDADFGQTLGKYGLGFGFYIVWPVLGPSSPRDTVGFAADWWLKPQTYLTTQLITPETAALYAHEEVNDTSFHLGDYEALKQAAIDPYVAMRDAYVQYRIKRISEK